jgi:hypothetical protein
MRENITRQDFLDFLAGKRDILSPELITEDELLGMSADEMRELALEFTTAAHNALAICRYEKVEWLQKQAELWTMAARLEQEAMDRISSSAPGGKPVV